MRFEGGAHRSRLAAPQGHHTPPTTATPSPPRSRSSFHRPHTPHPRVSSVSLVFPPAHRLLRECPGLACLTDGLGGHTGLSRRHAGTFACCNRQPFPNQEKPLFTYSFLLQRWIFPRRHTVLQSSMEASTRVVQTVPTSFCLFLPRLTITSFFMSLFHCTRFISSGT